jgi:hypothetical protein
VGALIALVRTDLVQRLRGHAFWLVLAASAAMAWAMVPDESTVGIGVYLDRWRGAYSSAWVGLSLALMLSTLLTLIGFYIVRGAIARDVDSGVWQLKQISNMTRFGYLLGRALAAWVVLLTITLIVAAVGLLAQWFRAEDTLLNPWELLKPLLVITAPALALSAAFAISFDSVRALRGALGNGLWFFLWTALIGVGAVLGERQTISDPVGITAALGEVRIALKQAAPEADTTKLVIGGGDLGGPVRTFVWREWTPSAATVLGRGIWLILAVVLIALASIGLDRRLNTTVNRPLPKRAERPSVLARLAPIRAGAPLVVRASTELRLALGRPRWWWLALIGAWVMQGNPAATLAMSGAWLAWLLLVPALAHAGLREIRFATDGLIDATAHARRIPIERALVLTLLCAAVVAPAALRHADAAAALLAIAVTLPLAALVLARALGHARPFEVLALLALYAAWQGAPVLQAISAPSATLLQHVIAILLLVPVWFTLERLYRAAR